jgi:hypothetical protein
VLETVAPVALPSQLARCIIGPFLAHRSGRVPAPDLQKRHPLSEANSLGRYAGGGDISGALRPNRGAA